MNRRPIKKMVWIALPLGAFLIAGSYFVFGSAERKPTAGALQSSPSVQGTTPSVGMTPAASPSPAANGGNLAPGEILAANGIELAAAMNQVKAGETIVMADGDWKNTIITFKAQASEEKPIKLRAQTPGKVILTGNSRLALESPYLVVDGLLFQDGTPTDKKAVIAFNSHYGQVTNTSVANYNPANPNTGYYWVYFNGNHNQLVNSSFRGKNHSQPLIGNDHNGKYNRVAACYFKDFLYRANQNGREVLRIWGYGGNDELGTDGAFFTVENNLFERADGEGDEIISLKSNNNVVRGNTIVETRGSITGRSGNTNTIEGNVILGNNFTGTKGIRVTGHHMKVVGNYVEKVKGTALDIMTGEHLFNSENKPDYLDPLFTPLAREGSPYGYVVNYGQVRDSLIEGNTFIGNSSTDLVIGSVYKKYWPDNQLVLLPENNRFVRNVFYKSVGGKAILATPQDMKPPFGQFTFQPNGFEGNTVYGDSSSVSLPDGTNGVKIEPPSGTSAPAAPKRLTPQDVGPEWARK